MTDTHVTGGIIVLDEVKTLAELLRLETVYEAAMTDPGVSTLSIRVAGGNPDRWRIADEGYRIATEAGKRFAFRMMAGRNAPAEVVLAGPHYTFDLSQAEFPQSGTAIIPLPCEPDGSPNGPLTDWNEDELELFAAWLTLHPDVELAHCWWPGRLWAEFDLGAPLTAYPGNTVDSMLNTHYLWWELASQTIPPDRVVEFAFSGHGNREGLISGLLARVSTKPDPLRYQFQMNGTNNNGVMYPANAPTGPPSWTEKVVRRSFQMVGIGNTYVWSRSNGVLFRVESAAKNTLTTDLELKNRIASETGLEVYIESFLGGTSAQLESEGAAFHDWQRSIAPVPGPPSGDCADELAEIAQLEVVVSGLVDQLAEAHTANADLRRQLELELSRIEDMKAYVAAR